MAVERGATQRSQGPDAGNHPGDTEVPPVVLCARCGRGDCPGCTPLPPPLADADSVFPIAWEAPGVAHWRLGRTALATVNRSGDFFGKLSDGDWVPALSFACQCEVLAIGSLLLPAPILLWPLVPRLAEWLLLAPAGLSVLLTIWLSTATLMVGMHVLWGLAIGWGSRGDDTARLSRRHLRFALYACGWDFVTSPLGLLTGRLLHAEPPRQLLALAMAAPSSASEAYLGTRCGFSATTRRAVLLSSVVTLATALLLVLGAVVLCLILWLLAEARR
jgi:hypothetical protein